MRRQQGEQARGRGQRPCLVLLKPCSHTQPENQRGDIVVIVIISCGSSLVKRFTQLQPHRTPICTLQKKELSSEDREGLGGDTREVRGTTSTLSAVLACSLRPKAPPPQGSLTGHAHHRQGIPGDGRPIQDDDTPRTSLLGTSEKSGACVQITSANININNNNNNRRYVHCLHCSPEPVLSTSPINPFHSEQPYEGVLVSPPPFQRQQDRHTEG